MPFILNSSPVTYTSLHILYSLYSAERWITEKSVQTLWCYQITLYDLDDKLIQKCMWFRHCGAMMKRNLKITFRKLSFLVTDKDKNTGSRSCTRTNCFSYYKIPSGKEQNIDSLIIYFKVAPLDLVPSSLDMPHSLRTLKEVLSQTGVGGNKCFSIDVVQNIYKPS